MGVKWLDYAPGYPMVGSNAGSIPATSTNLKFNTMNNYTWQQERQMLEDSYARRLLVEHNIKEVTTQRQAKNGTREFEFPCPSRPGWKNSPRLRLACFESGYVRKQNGTYTAYQINPQYRRKWKYVITDGNGDVVVRESTTISRALIHNPLTRMAYMLNYYIKNWKKYE